MALRMISAEFPPRIALGASSDPEWSTAIVMMAGGDEETNENWAEARHRYDVSLAIRTASDYAAVRAHFHQARGRARAFLFRDFLDDTVVAASDGVTIATSTPGTVQLAKRYGSGADVYTRRITRPVDPATVYRTRSAVTTVIAPTIDYETGLVTASGHQPGDVYTWSGRFLVPCRYDVDRLPAAAINRQPGEDGELWVECAEIPIVEVRE